jgi:hypothetical protein
MGAVPFFPLRFLRLRGALSVLLSSALAREEPLYEYTLPPPSPIPCEHILRSAGELVAVSRDRITDAKVGAVSRLPAAREILFSLIPSLAFCPLDLAAAKAE